MRKFFQNIRFRYDRMKMRHRVSIEKRKALKAFAGRQEKISVKIRTFFERFLDFKVKERQDTYTVLGFRTGRKTVVCLLLVITVVSILGIASVVPVGGMADGVRTYRYNALPLKFTDGQVRILGKSGYVAYEGQVSKGAVNGEGVLYAKDGSLVYQGEFQNNKYQGEGKVYYSGNQLQYEGQLTNNQFQGEGILYRKDGSKEYEGSFALGKKQGAGKLYDKGGKLVYTGNFVRDGIQYKEILGKSAADVAQMYTGARMIYEGDQEYCVYMKDIGSIYVSKSAQNTLEQEGNVEGIYVLSDAIYLDGKEYSSIKELKKKFRIISYEGNTSLTAADAVAVNAFSEKNEVLHGMVTMDTTEVFEDVITVNSVDKSYQAYVYQMEEDGITYTFFAGEKGTGFDFYLMERE